MEDDPRGRLEQMRSRFERIRAELDDARYSVCSDDGYVTATVDGDAQPIGLEINPRILRNLDSEALAEQILSCVRRAMDDAVAGYQSVVDRVRDGEDREQREES